MSKSKLAGLLPVFAILLLSWFPSNPPNAHTGAPLAAGGNEPTCTACHTPPASQPFAGNVSISGLPASIDANTSYPITVTVTKTAGTPVRAGFQLVALNSMLQNAGTIVASGGNTGTENANARTYIEHRPAQSFSGNTVTYTFDWVAPAGPNNDDITMYAVANIASGSNGNQNDLIVTTNQSGTLVQVGDPLTVTITNSTNLLCNGDGSGTATAEADGGSGAYTYSWSNGETGATASNLSEGLATVTVSDGSTTATANIIIAEPQLLELSIIAIINIDCITTIGSATALVTGGSPGYLYEWDNGESTATAVDLTAGMHTVTVTDDNNCSESIIVIIEESLETPDGGIEPVGNICAGEFTTLFAFVVDPQDDYIYEWDNDLGFGTFKEVVPPVTTTYSVTITGTNGCFDVASVTVFVTQHPIIDFISTTCSPDLLTYTILVASDADQIIAFDGMEVGTSINNGDGTFSISNIPADVDVNLIAIIEEANCQSEFFVPAPDCICPDIPAPNPEGATDITICEGETIPLLSAFGQGGEVIDWYDSATGGMILLSNSFTFQAAFAGTFYAEARNPISGCISSSRLAFTIIINPNPNPTITGATAVCEGSSSTLDAGADYDNYQWSTGATTRIITVNTSGDYHLTVTNAFQCFGTATIQVVVHANPTLELLSTTCSEDLSTYSILVESNAEQVYAQDVNNTNVGMVIDNGDGTLTIASIPAGENVTVTALNSSTADCMNEISITAPNCNCPDIPAPHAEGLTMYTICEGGNIPLFSAFGQDGQVIDWYDAATGGNLLQSNAFTFQATITGTYYAEARDPETNCVSSSRLAFTLTIHANPMVSFSVTNTSSIGANDGAVTANPTGGTPPYVYLWSGGAVTQTISDLEPGTYCVTVTDVVGCQATGCATIIDFDCSDFSDIEVTVSTIDVSDCFAEDGSIDIMATGGTGSYEYSIDGGVTWSSLSNYSGLVEMEYEVKVRNSNGSCETSGVFVIISGPTLPVLNSASITHPTGCGMDNGIIILNAGGGSGSLEYSIDGSTWQSNATFSNLASGTYITFVRNDDETCVVEGDTIILLAPNELMVNIIITSTTATGATITAEVTGGVAPYLYSWGNEPSTEQTITVEFGTYCVTVTDADQCTAESCVTVTMVECEDLIPTYIISDVSCPGESDGIIDITSVSGGTPPYSFDWSNGMQGSTITNLSIDDYIVTITDNNNCQSIITIGIFSFDNEAPVLINCGEGYLIQECNVLLFELPTATDNCGDVISITQTTGMPSGTPLAVGTHVITFTATDISGNVGVCSFEVNISSIGEVTFETTPEHDMDSDGTATAEVLGGQAPFVYEWTNSAGDVVSVALELTNVPAGVFNFSVIDANGCAASGFVEIGNIVATDHLLLNANITIAPNPTTALLYVEIADVNFTKATFELYNLQGQIITRLDSDTKKTALDVSQHPDGLYLLKITMNDKSIMKKVVIDK